MALHAQGPPNFPLVTCRQDVTVATMPEDYGSRFKEMFPGRLKKLKFFAPDTYDLVLSKLGRNSPKDQGDVEYPVKAVLLNAKILRDG